MIPNPKDPLSIRLQALATPAMKAYGERFYKTRKPVLGVPVPALRKLIDEHPKGRAIALSQYGRSFESDFVLIHWEMGSQPNLDAQINLLLNRGMVFDSWAMTDGLDFRLTKTETDLGPAKMLLASPYPYIRRIGTVLLIKLVPFLPANDLLSLLKDDDALTVKTAMAWLIAECYAKDKKAIDMAGKVLSDPKTWILANRKIRESLKISPIRKKQAKAKINSLGTKPMPNPDGR